MMSNQINIGLELRIISIDEKKGEMLPKKIK